MKIKISEATGPALDWAVAKCEYPELVWGETIGLSAHARDLIVIPQFKEPKCWWCPSTDWGQGGPIIEQEMIELVPQSDSLWDAMYRDQHIPNDGPTPLIAAMRCYVASKLGNEVDVPEELK